jgi:hypothetical protein
MCRRLDPQLIPVPVHNEQNKILCVAVVLFGSQIEIENVVETDAPSHAGQAERENEFLSDGDDA